VPPGSCVRVGCGPLPLSRAPAARCWACVTAHQNCGLRDGVSRLAGDASFWPAHCWAAIRRFDSPRLSGVSPLSSHVPGRWLAAVSAAWWRARSAVGSPLAWAGFPLCLLPQNHHRCTKGLLVPPKANLAACFCRLSRIGAGISPANRAPAAHWLRFADLYQCRVHATSNPHPGQSRSTSLLLLVLAPHHRLTPGGRACCLLSRTAGVSLLMILAGSARSLGPVPVCVRHG